MGRQENLNELTKLNSLSRNSAKISYSMKTLCITHTGHLYHGYRFNNITNKYPSFSELADIQFGTDKLRGAWFDCMITYDEKYREFTIKSVPNTENIFSSDYNEVHHRYGRKLIYASNNYETFHEDMVELSYKDEY